MITVEGMGDGHKVWVVWRPEIGLETDNMTIRAYCPNIIEVTPMIPCAVLLPPVGSPTAFVVLDGTGYGAKLTSMEVGTIISDNSVSRDPKPCQHSKLDAAMVYLGPPGSRTVPFFRKGFASHPNNVQRFASNGKPVSFWSGRAASNTDMYAYDNYGELVKIGFSSQEQYYAVTHLYSGIVPEDIPSSFLPYARISLGDYYWNKAPSASAISPFRGTRHTWAHVSDNVWEEVWIQEYHGSASYVPQFPKSPSGFGYEIASITRKRTHTLYAIQHYPKGTFTFDVRVEEVADWRYLDNYDPVPEPYYGHKSESYGYFRTCTVMAPGLCPTYNVPPMNWMDYCPLARERAMLLYDEREMTIARSNAIADVTGLQSNWIENLSQLKGTLSVVNPLLDGYKAVVHGDIYAAKNALSGALFAYLYTIKPTLSDIKDLDENGLTTIQSFAKYRFSNERRRGARHLEVPVLETRANLSYYCTFHFVLKDSSFSTIWNALEKLGLDPSVRNLWDLIPYSFVIDWFVSVGPALQKLSLYVSSVLTRQLKVRVQSFKVQWPLSSAECKSLFGDCLQVCGPATYTWYDRRIAHHIGVIDSFAGQSHDGLSVSQMVQGAALLSNYIR